MIKKTALVLAAVAMLSACDVVPVEPVPAPSGTGAASAPRISSSQAARSFVQVIKTVEPVAERECRARTSGVNCDFNIAVDDRPDQPANAYQTLDKQGRPVIFFTLGLIADARNADELAFVLGHEAAHHIAGHINRQQQNAVAGAVIFAGLATLSGGSAEAVQNAQRLGAEVGARRYSKDFELEADALGTIITARAGYDPLRGAEFFTRIPDPGDKFLGTHPPNAARIEVVRRTVAGL
ncbi:M48 family metallopeptidase [Sulfitobacter sp. PR48]|jgi:predicted Zn-dependent protease|uniref:M48 family metallopeptidase n=1 Tax=unclassified Sulfitobacter TaxID=196795 RepID=UPI0022AFF51F|nr:MULTISPECIES: M48 family metallopeptidase [unclassified Sulfitobacter]MCZ4255086.1 M48 family metallopeptidase [Sulfitobacter sp. G21635-S1]MDD9723010.1 M48 family metallopeptidase [Sulfitobacter sp. PR48]GLT08207.1 peptidase M48 [Sulfitobacter porphyrae]